MKHLFWGILLAAVLFLSTMIDTSMLAKRDELVICQFGYTKMEFIMEAQACKKENGTIYWVR